MADAHPLLTPVHYEMVALYRLGLTHGSTSAGKCEVVVQTIRVVAPASASSLSQRRAYLATPQYLGHYESRRTS